MTKPFESVWLRPPRQPKSSGLRRDQIVAAAIELLDAEGLDRLSMRKLGAKLDAGATSLYWYVANKNELLELALDEAWGEVALPDPDEVPWRRALTEFAYSLRETMLAHPWMVTLFGRVPSVGPKAFRLSDFMRRTYRTAGFGAMTAAYANGTLISYVVGQVVPDIALRQTGGRLEDFDTDTVYAAMRQLAGADYPDMVADMIEIQPENPAAARALAFDFGLLCVLDGLESRLREERRDAINSTDRERSRTPRQPDPR
ncbi:TetR/AcrR family transcriptional regulator [Nocardia pseudobrasiliensis]|uniref:TetR family transcriptional regulator n=1 Tax=Nocardia pseudobrasiliensis TaxID=45979 RepID=A0A370HYR0_9NOCA|nr:TetR/AcrR family transcriptional regulator [Nocardia pseudobrasiliensis]RDI63609.1 TetR family transcriptional regulator [Nocardia pseudobrasiliensis]